MIGKKFKNGKKFSNSKHLGIGEIIENMRLHSFPFKITLFESEDAVNSICALYL